MIIYLLIGLCVFLAVSLAVNEYYQYDAGPGETIGVGLFVLIVSGFASCLLFALVFGLLVPGNHTVKHEQPLAALSNHTGPSGSFFLGSGSVDGDSYLTYILQGSDGSYQIKTDDAYKYKIFQRSASGGSLVTYDSYLDAWWIAPFQIAKMSHPDSELHIPEGSIQTGYNIDVNK